MKKKNKVLITGATGLLGTHLILSMPDDIEVFATVHEYKTVLKNPKVQYVDLDVREFPTVRKVLYAVRPDVVIHTAAYSQVDFCENNQAEAKLLNYEATKFLVDTCNELNSKIIFCSSNMTFDGQSPPYDEFSKQNPQTFYGKTKMMSEKYIIEHAKIYTIFRLMTMYGWNWQPDRKNMISMAVGKLQEKQELWMTNDVYNNMLFVKIAAETFWKSLDSTQSDNQIFHLSGADCLNRYQTTLKLCEVFGFDTKLVHEVSSDYFKGKEASRAPNSCFNVAKAQQVLRFELLGLVEGFTQLKQNPLLHSSQVVKT